MTKRERVLAWLKICGEDWDCSKSCPYYHASEAEDSIGCMGALMGDAKKVIEEQQETITSLQHTSGNSFDQGRLSAFLYKLARAFKKTACLPESPEEVKTGC